jgi:hypothetical protein
MAVKTRKGAINYQQVDKLFVVGNSKVQENRGGLVGGSIKHLSSKAPLQGEYNQN